MRVTLAIEGATADEAQAFVLAFQRSRALQAQEVRDCTIHFAGGWSVRTVALEPAHAEVLMEEFTDWLNERAAALLMEAPPPPTPIYVVDRKEKP